MSKPDRILFTIKSTQRLQTLHQVADPTEFLQLHYPTVTKNIQNSWIQFTIQITTKN